MASKHVGASATVIGAPQGLGLSGLSDLGLLIAGYHLLVKMIDNFLMGDPGVSIATTTTQARTNATATFKADGTHASKASTDNFWTVAMFQAAVGFAVVPAGSTCRFLLLVDSAGVGSIIQGPVATSDAGAAIPPSLVPEAKCIFGVLKVAAGSVSFTPGTTALNAANITFTFIDGYDAAAVGAPIIDPLV